MEKINSLKQLKAEKERLRQRQAELEKSIQYDWRDLKESLKPVNIASQVYSAIFKKKEEGARRSFFTGKLSGIATNYAGRLAEKLGFKIGHWFKK